MPEHRLTPVTALGGSEPRIVTRGDVTIIEDPDVAIASLAARRNEIGRVEAVLSEMIGASVPAPGRIAGATAIEAMWTGPGQWLLLARHATSETLPESVKQGVGPAGSVTEQSDGWACFRLTGPGAGDLLERLCMLDVAVAAPGFAARTVIHHIGAFVIRDAAGWRILGPRSSAGSLFDTLDDVATGLAGARV